MLLDSQRCCWIGWDSPSKQEGNGPQEDKLTLACFNSGDVPELIGRLSVALSHATHKVISLPMFRKDLGVSVAWASRLACFFGMAWNDIYYPGAEFCLANGLRHRGRRGRRGLSDWDNKKMYSGGVGTMNFWSPEKLNL